jgi:hypothetical protein
MNRNLVTSAEFALLEVASRRYLADADNCDDMIEEFGEEAVLALVEKLTASLVEKLTASQDKEKK